MLSFKPLAQVHFLGWHLLQGRNEMLLYGREYQPSSSPSHCQARDSARGSGNQCRVTFKVFPGPAPGIITGNSVAHITPSCFAKAEMARVRG